MRILHVNKFLYPFGGAESYMFELANAQEMDGHIVSYWGMYHEKNIVEDELGSYAPKREYSDLKGFEKIKSAMSTIYSVESKRGIGKMLDEFHPDIIHLHNYNFQLTPSILKEIKKRGVKVVQTIHDSQMVCPWHRLYNFRNQEQCTKCVTGSFVNCVRDRCFNDSFLQSIIGAFESHLYHSLNFYNKYIDAVISPSLFLKNLVSKRVNVPIHVVPNFVMPISESISRHNGYILYFGRLSEEKGIRELIDIFQHLDQELLLIGDGDLFQKDCEYENINFLGPKYSIELHTYIQKARFVIQPSKWFENCPMTVIESFACGTPVIAADHSGFLELVSESLNGYLIDFSNKEKSIESLNSIFGIDEGRIMRENALSTYKMKFNKDDHLAGVYNVYYGLGC